MATEHTHAVQNSSNERSLKVSLALTGTFLTAEVAGSLVTGSLALLSDAAHMLTDTAALAIALVAIWIGRRAPDLRRTFGYRRFEILAAAFNAVLLFLVALYILFEAYRRLQNKPEVQSLGMLAIAVLGLAVNYVAMRLLRTGKETSLNVRGAYLEVWSDFLGSVGVIIGAVLIQWTRWNWIDSVIAIAIALWVLPRTWILLSQSVNILLEGVPAGLDVEAIAKAIEATPGALSVHDLHVWAITSGAPSLTAHVVVRPDVEPEPNLVPALRAMLAERFGIRHTTIQCEHVPCPDADGTHRYI